MADPRSNGHKQERPQNLGPLIIAAGIVLAGIIVAFAVIATRSEETGPITVVPQPSPVLPTPPVEDISPITSATADPADASARTALQDTLAAASAIHAETGTYSDATSFELATRLPRYTFLPASQPSGSAAQVSYYANGSTFSAAALDADGTCYWIKDDRTTEVTSYGTGEPCTGNAALGSAADAW